MIQHRSERPENPGRVVILGATGFVGRALVKHLEDQGVGTVALSSAQMDLELPESVDRLAAVLEETDALVFASALTPDRGKDAATLRRNLLMAEHVALVLKRRSCGHVIYVSSDAVYSSVAGPIRETTPCDAPGLYGPMHRLRENILAAAVDNKQTPLLILRPCALYGPGDTHNSYGPNRFIRTAQTEGRIALIGNGEEKRDHVAVGDFVRLIHACLRRRSAGVLNVATGQAVSFAEVAQLVARLSPPPVWIEPMPRTSPIAHRTFDTATLIRAFPNFRFTPLLDGITRTINHREIKEEKRTPRLSSL